MQRLSYWNIFTSRNQEDKNNIKGILSIESIKIFYSDEMQNSLLNERIKTIFFLLKLL